MIQRVQTIYLAIVMICLGISASGAAFFSYSNTTSRFTFDSFGITEYEIQTGNVMKTEFFPIFIGLIALTLLAFLCMMSYKNLKRQFKLGRLIFFLYLAMLISLLITTYFGSSLLNVDVEKRELGLGFLMMIIGFPFTFLANTGIKRDKALLDSLNRLR